MTTLPDAHTTSTDLKLDEGFFAARDDLRLYWRSLAPRAPERSRAHVAIVHGYAEHSGRYREFMERLAQAGIMSHAFDLRGHGQSDGRRAHVDRFGQYLEDLEGFLGLVRGAAEDRKVFLFGHSLGGLLCARWALGQRGTVAGLALSAPFLGFAFEPPRVKVLGARVLDRIAPWLPIPNGLSSTQLTRDLDQQRAADRDPLYMHHATPRWFLETAAAQREIAGRAGELSIPCLMVAGERDPIADLPTSRLLFERFASSDKTLQVYEGMRHEPLNEVGREQVYADLIAWIDSRL